MDLGTIRQRLRNKFYQSGNECVQDFIRLFTNAYIYNAPNTKVHDQASTLESALMVVLVEMPEHEVEQPEAVPDKPVSQKRKAKTDNAAIAEPGELVEQLPRLRQRTENAGNALTVYKGLFYDTFYAFHVLLQT